MQTASITGEDGFFSITYTWERSQDNSFTTFSVVGGNTFQLSDPTDLTGTWYYRRRVDNNGNTAYSNIVTIVMMPSVSITGTLTVCENSSNPTLTITALGGIAPYTITYNLNGVPQTAIATTTGAGTMTGTVTIAAPTNAAGTFTYSLTSVVDANSLSETCTNTSISSSATITVNPKPVLTFPFIQPSSPAICYGASFFNVTLTYTNSPTEYQIVWDPPAIADGFSNVSFTTNNFPAGGGITVVVPTSATSGATYTGTLTVRTSAGCESDPGAAPFKINSLPILGTITGLSTVCVGSTINLSNSLTGGSWTVNNANSTIGISSGVLTGSAAGTSIVTYSVTNGSGCSSLTTTTVTVNALPTVNAITGVSPVCVGSTLNLTSTTASGVWSVNNANAGINVSGTLTGQSAGTVNVSYTVTDGNSCTNLTTTTVTVNALPTVNAITGVSPVCVGSTLNLTSTTASGVWSVNNANAGINVSGTLTGQSAGTVNVSYTVTDGNSCTNLTTTTVTVNALPTVNAITGVSPVCVGSTLNLTSTTASGVWSVNNANAGINVSGTLTGQSAGTVNVSYTVTDGNGCTNFTSTTVLVNALPIINTITGATTVCVGSTINLSNATGGGIWSVNNANATINGTGVLTGQSAGAATVSYSVTDANNCTTTVTSVKTINALPVVAAISGSNAVCIGSTINLSNATGGGIWSVNNANATINGTGVLTGQSAGAATVSYSVTDANNCTTTVTSVKTINALPVVAAISGSNAVCIGSTINLSNATGGGIWSVNNANATINGTGVLTGQSAGAATVSYSVTDANNCTATVTAMKTIQSLPVANINPSGPLTFCTGNSVNLSATGGGNYLWSNGSTNANISNIISSGTYTVTVTDVNNCAATSAPVTITVNALPTVSITNPAAVCAPGTVDLTAAAITNGSTAGLTYSYWSNPAGTQTLSTPFAIGIAGTYYIRGTNTVTNCAAIQPVLVTINPQASILINTPAAVCAPGTVDITAAAITNGSAAGLSYTYFRDAAATTTLANANAVNTSGVYYIKGTPVSGCSAIVPVSVTINPLPTLVINNPAAVCSPQTINLADANITAGSSAGLSFAYFSNAALTAPIANAQALNGSGMFYIRATDAITGCFRSGAVTVQVNAAPQGVLQTPATNIICENGSLTLNATGGNSYQWLLNQQPITGANSATYNATAAGTYAVRFISAQGCSTTSSNSINLELLNKPTVQFTLTNACAGVSTSFNNTSVTGASGGINWLWDFGDGSSSNQFAPTHIYTSSGTYTVRLTATSPVCTGFNETSVVTYRVQSALPAVRYKDVDVLKDIPVTVTARAIGTSYLWLPATGVNNNRIATPSIRVNTTTEYTVAITNDIGCTTVDTILLKVIPGVDIYVPQGFTPNNDGQNDRLYPILVGMRQLNYFRVFNRWGTMIFTTKESSAQSGWNGLYLGVKQPMGTYTWMAEAVDLQGNVVRKTGTVLLLQ
ncbi:PKD domain-containing protein [Sediminibacterium goheungense]|uniref:PKD domain-containing protein n=1 Tax=Sediminibacterium goheungense TaxID=1086393 RepID=UPI0013C34B3A|nr:PKD domain-containing protein [Sediminibacterium goheungense]